MKPKGILISIEGTDGSGKATQTELLVNNLRQMLTHSIIKLSYPRYDNDSSALVRMYLDGKFGTDPESVNPYAASTFYAVDRYASYKDDWGQAYHDGAIIITDRYTDSNTTFQGSKLPPAQRQEYIDWLYDLEFNKMGIPRPNLTLYLDVPNELTAKLRQQRESKTHTHGDIHEANLDYIARCRTASLEIAQNLHWTIINCSKNGQMRDVQDIQQELLNRVLNYLNQNKKI